MSDVQEKEHDGPLTRVTKLKIGGDWDWNVSYIQTFQELTVHTNDSPRDSMTAAIADVVLKALAYIKIKDVLVLMDSISFADGEKGPTFTLVLNARSSENPYCRMKWNIAKIDREVKLDPRTNEDAKGFYERNRLNESVDILEEEIKQYALGNRLQKELKPIEDGEEKGKKQKKEKNLDLFDSARETGKAIARGISNMLGSEPVVINVDFAKQEAVQK